MLPEKLSFTIQISEPPWFAETSPSSLHVVDPATVYPPSVVWMIEYALSKLDPPRHFCHSMPGIRWLKRSFGRRRIKRESKMRSENIIIILSLKKVNHATQIYNFT